MWRIYYDSRTVDSNQSTPENTPGPGLICIVQPDEEVGRMVLSGDPYFWWDESQWWSGDLFGLYDYLMRPGFKIVRFGRTVSNQRFREIMDRAINDPDFPPKSGWRRGERR